MMGQQRLPAASLQIPFCPLDVSFETITSTLRHYSHYCTPPQKRRYRYIPSGSWSPPPHLDSQPPLSSAGYLRAFPTRLVTFMAVLKSAVDGGDTGWSSPKPSEGRRAREGGEGGRRRKTVRAPRIRPTFSLFPLHFAPFSVTKMKAIGVYTARRLQRSSPLPPRLPLEASDWGPFYISTHVRCEIFFFLSPPELLKVMHYLPRL